MKKLLVPILILLSLGAFAQGSLKFKAESHDFGIVEEGQMATYVFEATNTGNQPVVISNVQASCGCTTPEYPKEPVMPGATAKIKASFNSAGRPGAFNKSITVYANLAEQTKVLYIKGIVEKKEAKPQYTAAQLKVSPKVKFEKTGYNFGKVERGQKLSYKFKLTNTGLSDLTITDIQTGCSCVSQTMSSTVIKPNESAVMEIVYTPKSLGENNDIVVIKSNDITQTVQLKLQSNVVTSLSNQNMMKEGGQKGGF